MSASEELHKPSGGQQWVGGLSGNTRWTAVSASAWNLFRELQSCNSLSSQPKLFWETGICRHVSFGRVASKRQPKEQIQIGSKQDAFSTNYCHKGKLVTPQNKRRHQNKKQLITKTATKNIVFPGNSRINHGWCSCMWKTCRIRLS